MGIAWQSLGLNEFQRLLARPFDHHRPRLAQLVWLFEDRHTLTAQLRDPAIQVSDAQRDVVLQLPTRTDQRRVALVRIPGQHHITELNPSPRATEHAFAIQRRPGAISAAWYLAVRFGHRHLAKTGPRRGVEVLLIPKLCAIR